MADTSMEQRTGSMERMKSFCPVSCPLSHSIVLPRPGMRRMRGVILLFFTANSRVREHQTSIKSCVNKTETWISPLTPRSTSPRSTSFIKATRSSTLTTPSCARVRTATPRWWTPGTRLSSGRWGRRARAGQEELFRGRGRCPGGFTKMVSCIALVFRGNASLWISLAFKFLLKIDWPNCTNDNVACLKWGYKLRTLTQPWNEFKWNEMLLRAQL